MTGTAWPEAIWRAPVLRGLDARAQREIEAAGELRALARGAPVYGAGEPADAFFVVETGRVAIRAVPRGETAERVLREVSPGEAFGEEATLRAGAARQMRAVCVDAGRVAVVPAAVFARSVSRGGGGDVAKARRRALERAATLDLLRTLAFTRSLPERDLEILLDAGAHRDVARGEAIYREGDEADHVYFVVDGRIQLQTEDDGRIRVRAYLGRGDAVGDLEVTRREPRSTSAVAAGAASVLAVPRAAFLDVAARHPGLADGIRRVVEGGEGRLRAIGSNTTRHVLKDLYRLDVARSLLVIDEDACVRCGHCAWSCASTHDDGVSRLVRRGDKVVARTDQGAASLLLPSSCQHCENPACMPDCPTGAIGRDARGDVFIREDLCTGCGACARGCPWNNIQMAPRLASLTKAIAVELALPADAGPSPIAVGASPEVAVKCDLCHGRDAGPACVAACPTSAIARIHPSEVLPEVRAAIGAPGAAPRVLPRPRPMAPWIVGAALVALSIASLGALQPSRSASGALACAIVIALGAYPGAKRWLGLRVAGGARPHYVAHVALGVLAAGVVALHAGARGFTAPRGALAATLAWAFAAASAAGAFGAVVYRAIPARLTRLEKGGLLPEDFAARAQAVDEGTFRDLSGRSDVVKALFARVVQPYRASRVVVPLLLVASGRAIGEEEARLRARIDAVVAGRKSERLQGIDGLIRGAVERQSLRARRLLLAALRGWLLLHVVLAVIVVGLTILHGVVALRYAP